MTNEQRQKIITLRYQGFEYKEIAKATGLSRDQLGAIVKETACMVLEKS